MLVPSLDSRVSLPQPSAPRKIVLLGSTGSIGSSAVELILKYPERFDVTALVAHMNISKLAEQARLLKPGYVVIADSAHYQELKNELSDHPEIEIMAGEEAITHVSSLAGTDIVLAAISGSSGIRSVMAALQAGIDVALANKEALVAAGELIAGLILNSKARILPVDSEHSGLFQLLQGHNASELNSLILTASGGPFLDTPLEELCRVTPEQALKHPRWSMGVKNSLDSSTMVNKGLELIEAHWLFGIPQERIEVVVHPQSIVHSLVRFSDGTLTAHMSVADMKAPISFAIWYPYERLAGVVERLDLVELHKLEFRPLSEVRFPAIKIVRNCLRQGGAACAVFNFANEIAGQAFLDGKLRYDQIISVIESCLALPHANVVESLESLLQLKEETSAMAMEYIKRVA